MFHSGVQSWTCHELSIFTAFRLIAANSSIQDLRFLGGSFFSNAVRHAQTWSRFGMLAVRPLPLLGSQSLSSARSEPGTRGQQSPSAKDARLMQPPDADLWPHVPGHLPSRIPRGAGRGCAHSCCLQLDCKASSTPLAFPSTNKSPCGMSKTPPCTPLVAPAARL